MIREYAPIGLIPAAWAVTFWTVVYPGLETYWIEHMHYFITGFLGLFILISWNEMSSGALKTWRNIILLGIFATGAGALSFNLEFYPHVLASISVFYWLAAPGIASYYMSEDMGSYSKGYRFVGYAGITSLLLYLQGYILGSEIFKASAIIIAAVSQSYSILVASKLDS